MRPRDSNSNRYANFMTVASSMEINLVVIEIRQIHSQPLHSIYDMSTLIPSGPRYVPWDYKSMASFSLRSISRLGVHIICLLLCLSTLQSKLIHSNYSWSHAQPFIE